MTLRRSTKDCIVYECISYDVIWTYRYYICSKLSILWLCTKELSEVGRHSGAFPLLFYGYYIAGKYAYLCVAKDLFQTCFLNSALVFYWLNKQIVWPQTHTKWLDQCCFVSSLSWVHVKRVFTWIQIMYLYSSCLCILGWKKIF